MDDRLPEPLTADRHDGSAWLSVVPFTNVAVRPKGLPRALGVRLPEVNVRTYVTHDGVPSVYFFSLDADGLASVAGARLFHHLPYYYARISLSVADGRVRFDSRRRHPGARPGRYRATYRPTGEAFDAAADPLAAFLVERYRFYTEAPDGSVRYTDVEHDPWTLYPAEATVETDSLSRAGGFARPDREPVYYYSPGVDVVASRSGRLGGGETDGAAPGTGGPVVLFDGVCNLCNGVVAFLLPRDPDGLLRFAPLQSEAGRALLRRHDLSPDTVDTVVLVEGDRAYTKSDAAIRIAELLGWPYRAAGAGRLLPAGLRDRLYDVVAENRYDWFGRRDRCAVPDEDVGDRFLP
jgi:uncharacterized protein YqjF (DUF2071 family)/predicted DCC family thiol-disulfide oxidoreductase YuxK